jgi:cytoskeletal protein CcmA (bactofilin family)
VTPAEDDTDAPKPQVVPADPLADGTVPTVLNTGASHKSVAKGKASIANIYRKADILTTIFTFVGALVAAGIIFGIYAYITRTKTSNVAAPKVTSLDKTELDKLSTFFDGNSAGSSSQVLTISSSSLFKNRVAISSDLKVIGGLQVSGPTALGDLTVDKTTTLGVTNIRGQLVVAGPVNFQSPAQFGAGGTVNGNLAVTGNGSFGGSISAGTLNVRDISVSGTINLAGHLSISGQTPGASALSGAGSGASANVDGNDTSGTLNINTGNVSNTLTGGVQLATVTFRSAYPRVPHIVITPIGQSTGELSFFIIKTATGFTVGTATLPHSNTSYAFDFWVVQ